jgi:hypothetical protein
MSDIKPASSVQLLVITVSPIIGPDDQRGGAPLEYEVTADGLVKHVRDLGLPTSAANGAMSRLPKRRDSPTEIEPGMNQ